MQSTKLVKPAPRRQAGMGRNRRIIIICPDQFSIMYEVTDEPCEVNIASAPKLLQTVIKVASVYENAHALHIAAVPQKSRGLRCSPREFISPPYLWYDGEFITIIIPVRRPLSIEKRGFFADKLPFLRLGRFGFR